MLAFRCIVIFLDYSRAQTTLVQESFETDGEGIVGSASTQVYVPYSNNGTAVDDGVAYEVTGDCNNSKSSFIADVSSEKDQIRNYPNPFYNKTTFEFTVSETTAVSLKVYNSMGKHIATLYEGVAEPGQLNSVEFDGSSHSKGVYIYHLTSGNGVNVMKKMILMK